MNRPLSRRALLERSAHGFGALAAACLFPELFVAARASGTASGAESSGTSIGAESASESSSAGAASRPALARLHHRPQASRVIFLYMDGGPSQVDTFDPKPRLDREHGQPIGIKTPPTQFNNVGNVLRSPWKFRPRGRSGMPISDLLPEIAGCADELAVIRSMVSPFSEHTNANYFLHSGAGQQGRPSMGAWTTYGLGSENQELPGFVVLECGLVPPGGRDCFHSGFLPAAHQASIFRPGAEAVADLHSPDRPELQQRKRALLGRLERLASARRGADPQIEAAIANHELAFRMQTSVPELTDLSRETPATRRLYGLDDPATELYGRNCLLARRLIERGVRFVEVLCPQVPGDRWDQHSNLKEGHENNARATDRPIAGLLKDLRSRGLLEETVVVWAGEFGRTPMAQGSDGRDHNPFGFSIWLAGGGIRGGTIYGATDDYGYYAIEGKTEIHDLHATLLHLLGVDHTRLTYRFGGRDMRLTDVHGHVVRGVLSRPEGV